MTGIKDKVCVIGMGCTKFGERFDTSREDLILEAVDEALKDANLELSDIDAFWFGSFYETCGVTLSTILKTDFKPVTRIENQCCTGMDAFRNASFGVASGAHDTVMAIGLEKMKDFGYSGNPFPNFYRDGTIPSFGGPAAFSLLVPAYREKYGVSYEDIREAMACVAYKNHYNGSLNPKALYQKETPIEKIRKSPMVCEPYLSIMDCSGVSDGCACAILTSAKNAQDHCKDPMYIKCSDLTSASGYGTLIQDYDFTTVQETVACAKDAYKNANIKDPVKEFDLVELHDCFTITEIILYEDLMLSERGQGWKDAIDGKYSMNGVLPVNIDGGLKSFGHPIGASGIRMLYEIWLQFHGRAGKRQLKDPKLGMAHNLGGNPWECVSSITIVGNYPG